MTKSPCNVMTSMPAEPPEDMLMLGNKPVGVYHEVDALPENPDIMYKTVMHDRPVSGEGLEFTIDPDYDLVILEGCRESHAISTLVQCVRYNSTLIWNDLELYIVGVGYEPLINTTRQEDHSIIVIATCELEPEVDA